MRTKLDIEFERTGISYTDIMKRKPPELGKLSKVMISNWRTGRAKKVHAKAWDFVLSMFKQHKPR